MVQVAAEVDILLGGLGHHLAGFADVVGDGFLDQHVLAGLHRLHRRLEVPGAVLETAGGDIHDVQVFVGQHVFQAVVGLHAVFLGGGVRAFFDHVADRHQVGQRVLFMRLGMRVADAAHPDNTDFESHDFLLVT